MPLRSEDLCQLPFSLQEGGKSGSRVVPAQLFAINPKLPVPFTAFVSFIKGVLGTRRLVPANEISVLRLWFAMYIRCSACVRLIPGGLSCVHGKLLFVGEKGVSHICENSSRMYGTWV